MASTELKQHTVFCNRLVLRYWLVK